jgi:hypothetical protein
MGKIIVTVRCALCFGKGVDMFRVLDRNGVIFWSDKKAYNEIAISQRLSDALKSKYPYSHIPLVLSCGHGH